MIIIVTGTPATGKTTLSKFLSEKKGFEYIDLNQFSKDNGLIVGFDEERDCDIIDESKLTEKIKEYTKDKNVVIDSHLSHYISPDIVDQCIVTKCNLRELKTRLEKRGYSFNKVRENLDSDIFDTCMIEASEEGHKVSVIKTDEDVEKQLKELNII